MKRCFFFLVLFALLPGCAAPPERPVVAAIATPAPVLATQPPTTTSVPTPTVTPLPTATALPTATPTARPPATVTPAPPTATAVVQRYIFPVQGATVEYGKTHHDYPAADIFCPIGSQFVAPIDGVVDSVSREDLWNPASDKPEDRGGLSVAIIGIDGVRYYGSHLSQIAEGITPGTPVAAGTLLGLTGKSGNARFTPPHLHFGISHPTTPGDWQVRRGEIPPYRYLRAWQRGDPPPVILSEREGSRWIPRLSS